jgi:hypothetical protein
MSVFWSSLGSELRERGRNATLFFLALGLLLTLFLGSLFISHEAYTDYVLPALPWASGSLAIVVVIGLLKARGRRRERGPRGPLSGDELSKARSKLVKSPNRRPS